MRRKWSSRRTSSLAVLFSAVVATVVLRGSIVENLFAALGSSSSSHGNLTPSLRTGKGLVVRGSDGGLPNHNVLDTSPTPFAARFGASSAALPVVAAAAAAFASTKRVSRSAEGDVAPAEAAPAPPKPKAVRIDAFDSIRFVLIAYIVCGHFISFAGPSDFGLKLITQINVVVGAFFVLSGYVAAYTSCELGERKAKDKVVQTPIPNYIVSKVFGYWPLHFVVLLLFAPMFLYADNLYNGPVIAAAHGLMSLTMTQAWFPLHAEVWNAPTWFLSALTFATVLQPYFLPILAKQNKQELRRSASWLTIFLLLPRLAYCYDTNGWRLLEGAMAPTQFSNLAFFNSARFNPVWAVMEVMLGFVACRLVMLDGTDGETPPKPSVVQTVLPLLGMVAVLLLRATGTIALSDMLTRSLIFMPLFCLFLMGLHRASIQKTITDPLAKLLKLKPLTWLGSLAFPIFVVHGPLGQLFYKKAIAKQVFGGTMYQLVGPQFFYAYLGIVGVAAVVLKKLVVMNPAVFNLSKSLQKKIVRFL